MTPEERTEFTAKHDCGHNPDQFASSCELAAQGCASHADCLTRQLEEVANMLPFFKGHSPSEMERAADAVQRIDTWLTAVKRNEAYDRKLEACGFDMECIQRLLPQ